MAPRFATSATAPSGLRRTAWYARTRPVSGQGLQNKEIAEPLGIGRVQVARWRERRLEAGVGGIEPDLPRGAPPV